MLEVDVMEEEEEEEEWGVLVGVTGAPSVPGGPTEYNRTVNVIRIYNCLLLSFSLCEIKPD